MIDTKSRRVRVRSIGPSFARIDEIRLSIPIPLD
jgi:hypothetical protein